MANGVNNLNLARYKASGVYTIEIDQSTTVTVTPPIGRLLIGSSKKGPINTAVQIRNITQAVQVYGDVDRSLENNGSYFHRTLHTMLSEGDVYAMNVMPIDLTDNSGNLDKSYITTFNTEIATNNDPFEQINIKDVYNRQNFWYPDEDRLNFTKNSEYVGGMANKVLTFSNMSKRPVSIFIQKASVSGFDVTVKEWYAGGGNNVEIPTFLHGDDFISDYYIDVIVVEGQWTDYLRLSQDPVYYKYFSASGLNVSKINEFLSLIGPKLLARAQGILIPEFVDRNGNTISIDRVFNNLYPLTEIFCALDETKMDEIVLTPNTYTGYVDDTMSTHRIDFIGHGFDDLTDAIDDYDNTLIDVMSYKKPSSYNFQYAETAPGLKGSIVIDTISETYDFVKAYEESNLYLAWKYGFLKTGDLNIKSIDSPQVDVYINITEGSEVIGLDTVKYIGIRATTSPGSGAADIISEVVGADTIITFKNSQINYKKEISLSIFDSVVVTNNSIKLETTNLSQQEITDILVYLKKGAYLKAKVGATERPRILKILSVAKTSSGTIGSPSYSEFYTVTVMTSEFGIETYNKTQIDAYIGVVNFVDTLSALYVPEFTVRAGLLPDGTATRQQTIYKYITDTNLGSAIIQGQSLDLRQIVDSYNGDISSSSKYYLVKLAADHGKSFAIVNDPSISQFSKSNDPSFIDSSTGLVSMEYVSNGGNLDLSPSFTFNFPRDVTESGIPIESYAFFTMPYVIINENNKNKAIPPAGYISNIFMRKLKSGNQYGIAAGRRGTINEPEVIGLEYDLTDSDRGFLEPVGHNLLVRRRGIGTMLFSNNTAYQSVQSALNNAHVRDTLITIENNIEDILYNFLFSFNDDITRIRVTSLLENYLDDVMSAKGISYYDIQFDDLNNTSEVLESNSAIVDITIDFPRGIHKFINRVTITRVGGSTSTSTTGFLPQ